MIFFYNKGMNIIYLYFVNILYRYLRKNCEIFKFFFFEKRKISAAAHQTSLFEVGTFVHSGNHRFYLKSIRFQIQLRHICGSYLNLNPQFYYCFMYFLSAKKVKKKCPKINVSCLHTHEKLNFLFFFGGIRFTQKPYM